MPKNKQAYLRYLTIHSQIKRNKRKKGFPSKTDLMEKLKEQGFSVSESTLEKDLSFLKNERGAPLIWDAYQRCYRYTDPDWEFDIPLSAEALDLISMLVHKLEPFSEAPEFKMVRDSIDRLSGHLGLVNKHHDNKLDKYILLEYSKGFTGKELLPLIYDAIYENKRISFCHQRYDSAVTTSRTLEPYALKEHRNRWYVIGKENCENKIFGLDRISELVVLDSYFIKSTAFYDEIFSVLRDAVGVMAFGYKSEEVQLKFFNIHKNYIKSLPLHRSQEIISEDDQSITIRLFVKITREMIMDCILRFGEGVMVLKPDSLVSQLKEIYETVLIKYAL